MSFQSQGGHVGLKTQTAKGTYADPGAIAPNQGVFLKTRGGALGGSRDLLIPDAEIGGNRDVPDAKIGPIKFVGSYDFYGRMESIATLLNGAFGHAPQTATIAVDASSGTFTITFGGQTTTAIAYNATAAAVQAAFTALSTVGAGNATVTGGPGNVGHTTPYVITFTGTLATGDQAAPTTTPTLTGGTASAAVTMANTITSGSAGTGYTHLITPQDSGSLPWLSVEERIADGFEIFKYTDAKISDLHFEAAADGYFMGTAGFVALTQAETTATSDYTARYDNSPLMVGTNVTVTWNSIQLPAQSFKFDLKNNIEDTDFRLGSLFLGNLTEKRREITMGVKIRPQDSSLWKTAMWGSSVATSPGGLTTKQGVVITVTSYEDIPGAGAGIKYSLSINVPQAIIKPHTVVPKGDDVLESDIEIEAVRPNPATPILTATVVNSYAAVA